MVAVLFACKQVHVFVNKYWDFVSVNYFYHLSSVGLGNIQKAFLVCLVLSTVQAQGKAGLHTTDCKWIMSQTENSLIWLTILLKTWKNNYTRKIYLQSSSANLIITRGGKNMESSREALVCISPKLLHKRVVLSCSTSPSICHCTSAQVSHFWALQLQVCGYWGGEEGWVWAFQWSQLVWDCYLSQKDNQLFWIANWDTMCW